ncbi:hypothetical protein BDA96_06G088800 [Sorghum bicolor]|uniref:Uncharacterized protein n=2 Tax=Sorghum bicolor TaxID=4558 RepID=A0A921UBQ3_SORBI|nr:hypothetical protein BDA96_06G088800 [Sorghum bicolor]OQU81591.1 hypothetical protein SORBI_3006G080750 [Sorghum bicolor]
MDGWPIQLSNSEREASSLSSTTLRSNSRPPAPAAGKAVARAKPHAGDRCRAQFYLDVLSPLDVPVLTEQWLIVQFERIRWKRKIAGVTKFSKPPHQSCNPMQRISISLLKKSVCNQDDIRLSANFSTCKFLK